MFDLKFRTIFWSHTKFKSYYRTFVEKKGYSWLFFVCFFKIQKVCLVFAKIWDHVSISGMHTNDRLNVRTREGKVIVNISEKNPNQVLYVADSIESVIKPHQIGGVRFLYDNIIESPSVYQSSPGKILFYLHIHLTQIQKNFMFWFPWFNGKK